MDKQVSGEEQMHGISNKIQDLSCEEFQNECCSKCGGNIKLTSQGEIRDVIQQAIGNMANQEEEIKTRIFDVELRKLDNPIQKYDI